MSTALDDEGEVIHCFKYFHHLDKWMAVELDWVKLDNTQQRFMIMDWNEVKEFPKDDMILLQLASFVFKGQALFEA